MIHDGESWPYRIHSLPGAAATIEGHLLRSASRQRHLGDRPGCEILLVGKVDLALTDGIGRLLGALGLDLDYALVGRQASFLHAPHLGIPGVWSQHRQATATADGDRTPFTAPGLWTVRALLADGLPPADRRWPPALRRTWTSAGMLAQACGCGLTTMNRLLMMFEEHGWLAPRRRQRPYHLAIPLAPLEAWCHHLRPRLHRRWPVRPVFATSALRSLDQVMACRTMAPSDDWRIGGWQAIDHHGLSSVATMASKPVEVITSDVDELMRRWELMACEARDAAFVLGKDDGIPLPVMDDQGVRWSDPLTAALEVVTDREQGPAQAEAIMRRLADAYQPPRMDRG